MRVIAKLLGLICLLSAVLLARQDTPAEVSGRVVDVAGTALPGVTVTIRPFAGGPPIVVKSSQEGTFQASGLARGIYTIEFSLAGFDTLTHHGVVLLPGERFQLNVRLLMPRGAAPAVNVGDPGLPVATGGSQTETLRPGEVRVRLETQYGAIDLAIDTVHAPITAANFLKYVDGGFYDGGRFHRATRPDNYTPAPPDRPMMEIIQGGINPDRRDQAFPPIPLERTSVTGLKHVIGTVSMARAAAADTARSDFFILLDDQPSLDFGGKRFEDGQGAAAFGRVISGLDVVRKIQQQPVQGQNLTPPVPIVRAHRAKEEVVLGFRGSGSSGVRVPGF